MHLPQWIEVILLGIIEGVTEFLPISSTGHLLLAQQWLTPRSDLFNVVIQCGAVLAVLPLFPERLKQLAGFWRDAASRDYLIKLIAAFAITGAGGLVLEKLNFELPERALPVAMALFVGGVLFVVVERWLGGKTTHDQITWIIVVAVGLGQLVAAIFPGASRSGTTILLALILGTSRVAATEFSFLVGIPTIMAASGLKVFEAIRGESAGARENWTMVLIGGLVAAVVSFVAVKWLLRYIQTHTFVGFGWYRIALGILVLLFAASAG